MLFIKEKKRNALYTAYGQSTLKSFSKNKNILDEQGEVFHFKTHQFRHTYAVKLLNGGADILTIQELLAHSSPEMTLRYAKLLDDTKERLLNQLLIKGLLVLMLTVKLKIYSIVVNYQKKH